MIKYLKGSTLIFTSFLSSCLTYSQHGSQPAMLIEPSIQTLDEIKQFVSIDWPNQKPQINASAFSQSDKLVFNLPLRDNQFRRIDSLTDSFKKTYHLSTKNGKCYIENKSEKRIKNLKLARCQAIVSNQ